MATGLVVALLASLAIAVSGSRVVQVLSVLALLFVAVVLAVTWSQVGVLAEVLQEVSP